MVQNIAPQSGVRVLCLRITVLGGLCWALCGYFVITARKIMFFNLIPALKFCGVEVRFLLLMFET
jgi:uncharacterized membrane protein YuzA (DUF378 family)